MNPLDARTREFIDIDVTTLPTGFDPTALRVAVVPLWQASIAETPWLTPELLSGTYKLQVGVGTSVPLTTNQWYAVLMTLTDNPEVPVLPIGSFRTFV